MSHLPPKARGLACTRRISASVPPTSPGNPLTPAPRAQVGHLAGRARRQLGYAVLICGRSEGMVEMKPLKAKYKVSIKQPPQPRQPLAVRSLGCLADAPFYAVLQALVLWVARARGLMCGIPAHDYLTFFLGAEPR